MKYQLYNIKILNAFSANYISRHKNSESYRLFTLTLSWSIVNNKYGNLWSLNLELEADFIYTP
jgi:hypothetical protein